MNKANNKRSRETDEAIIRAAFGIMVGQNKPISKITVREICETAEINRSTFYAHYMDVYDLFEKVEQHMAEEYASHFFEQFHVGGLPAALEWLFAFIAGYREFYQIYFKEVGRISHLLTLMTKPFEDEIRKLKAQDLGYGVEDEILYHYNYFTAGMGALLALWLDRDCKETPHELFEILRRVYGPHSLLRTWLEM